MAQDGWPTLLGNHYQVVYPRIVLTPHGEPLPSNVSRDVFILLMGNHYQRGYHCKVMAPGWLLNPAGKPQPSIASRNSFDSWWGTNAKPWIQSSWWTVLPNKLALSELFHKLDRKSHVPQSPLVVSKSTSWVLVVSSIVFQGCALSVLKMYLVLYYIVCLYTVCWS